MKFSFDTGKTYEDVYSGWLDFFRAVAESDEPIAVSDVPHSWVPLLIYLGGDVVSSTVHFPCDRILCSSDVSRALSIALQQGLLREFVESSCCYRPELVDAMWKSDMEWNTKRLPVAASKEFVVTNNGSFHRPEVISFLDRCTSAHQWKRGIVLVPCAADKPYPAPLHVAVRSVIPDDYRIAVVTGVLGVVPEELWGEMPNYDSGVPNRWRVMEAVRTYFDRCMYEKIVVYSDFYSEAISYGLDQADPISPMQSRSRVYASFPLEQAGYWVRGSSGYCDLMSKEALSLLQKACE